jgi:hypothetical protein
MDGCQRLSRRCIRRVRKIGKEGRGYSAVSSKESDAIDPAPRRRSWLSVAVRKKKGAKVTAVAEIEDAAFEQPKVLLNACLAGNGVVLGELSELMDERPALPIEGDAATAIVTTFERSHGRVPFSHHSSNVV